jgi:hypothetical protein
MLCIPKPEIPRKICLMPERITDTPSGSFMKHGVEDFTIKKELRKGGRGLKEEHRTWQNKRIFRSKSI